MTDFILGLIQNDFLFVVVLLIFMIFFHEFCHWIPAKMFKVSNGFPKLNWWGGLELPCKKTTLKKFAIIGYSGVFIPTLIYLALSIIFNSFGFFMLVIIQLLFSVADCFQLFIVGMVIKKNCFNNPKEENAVLGIAWKFGYEDEVKKWEKRIQE